MGKKITKSNVFAGIAAVILFFAFTLHMVVFYNVPDKIKKGKTDEITSFFYTLCILY